jgi:hypothetical protein
VFGWGNISLIGNKPYRIPLVFTFVSMILSLVGFWKNYSKSGWIVVFWLFLFILFSSIYAWFTGISMNSLFRKAYLPVARFIYPAIFAIILLLVYGWSSLIAKLKEKYKIFSLVIYFGIFIVLDILSLISILKYF